MNKKYIQYSIILLLLVVFSCKPESEKLVFKLGEYELCQKEFDNIIKDNNEKYHLTPQALRDKIINEGFMLANALELGYDTISIVKNKFKYSERLFASEVGGFVWNRKVKPNLKVSKAEVEAAHAQRGKNYTFEVIHFLDKKLLDKYHLAGGKINSLAEFNRLKLKVNNCDEVKVNVASWRFPFYPIGPFVEGLEGCKPGDVFGPFETLMGWYVVHVSDVQAVEKQPIEKEYAIIESVLERNLKMKYIWKSQQEIFANTQPQMHDDVIEEIADKCVLEKREWPGIDNNVVLMEYWFKGEKRQYLLSDFKEYVNCQPIIYGSLKKLNDIKKMLRSYLINVYLFDVAQQLEMEKDSAYNAFKERYQRKLLLQYYQEQQLNMVQVSELEVKNYYNSNLQQFQCNEIADVSIYRFGSMRDAYKGYDILRQKAGRDVVEADVAAELSNLLSYEKHKQIELTDTVLNSELYKVVMGTNAGAYVRPIDIDGEPCVIFVEGKSGSAVIPYVYMQSNIKQTLLKQKREKALGVLQEKLKAKYIIEVNKLSSLLL
nr:peptidyl-prolyl cis-trans isomerase [uncultured Draconibacterium sp.]